MTPTNVVIIVLVLASSLALLVYRNAIRLVIALAVLEGAIFLFAIAYAYAPGAVAPLLGQGERMVNPLPHALVLTAIVISACSTALALTMVINLQSHIESVNLDDMRELGG